MFHWLLYEANWLIEPDILVTLLDEVIGLKLSLAFTALSWRGNSVCNSKTQTKGNFTAFCNQHIFVAASVQKGEKWTTLALLKEEQGLEFKDRAVTSMWTSCPLSLPILQAPLSLLCIFPFVFQIWTKEMFPLGHTQIHDRFLLPASHDLNEILLL